MRKYFKLIFIFMIGAFFLTGCTGSVTRALRHAGYSVEADDFVCDVFMPENSKDTDYSKVKYMLGGYVILEDGTFYDLSMGQYYANKQNCKKTDTNLKLVAIFDDKYFRTSDEKIYYLNTSGDTPAFTEVLDTDNSYDLVKLLLGDVSNLKIVTADSSNGSYYILRDDGNVYNYTVVKDKNTKVTSISSTEIIYNHNDYGGNKIIDFNYAGDSLNTYVKTSTEVYRMRVTNLEKCSSYADVACKYEMQKDTVFDEYSKYIVYFSGTYLFTNYGRLFAIAS